MVQRAIQHGFAPSLIAGKRSGNWLNGRLLARNALARLQMATSRAE